MSSYLLLKTDKPIAYAELWSRPAEMGAEIKRLLVDPSRREEGFGRKMLDLVFDRATRKPGVVRLTCIIGSVDREVVACFISAGFELVAPGVNQLGLKLEKIVSRQAGTA